MLQLCEVVAVPGDTSVINNRAQTRERKVFEPLFALTMGRERQRQEPGVGQHLVHFAKRSLDREPQQLATARPHGSRLGARRRQQLYGDGVGPINECGIRNR